MIGDIDITTNIPDLPELNRRLSDSARRVLVGYETQMLEQYQDGWVGWKYKGRPPGAPRNVSMQAWKTRVQSTREGAALIVENNAKDWRTNTKTYAAFVKRKKGAQPEWLVFQKRTEETILPVLAQDLAKAVEESYDKPAPTRKIRTGVGETQTLELEF